MLMQKDKIRLQNYFKEMPKVPMAVKIIWLVLLAASITFIVLCSGLTNVFSEKYSLYPFIGFGILILLLILHIMHFVYRMVYRASEKEVDIQYLKLVSKEDVVELGREKFGFSENQKFMIAPVVFHNFADKAQNSLSTPFLSKKGKDGLFRSTHIVSLAYFFSEEILFQFGFICDIYGGVKCTVCDDIYYRDISKNVQVTSVSISAPTSQGISEIVREKIVMYTRSHGIIHIPYWNTDSQKDSFNKMRQHIRSMNMAQPAPVPAPAAKPILSSVNFSELPPF